MDNRPVGVEHYENFPVASWLCPRRLRAPIEAIYHFARTADDIADEGDAPAAERLALLDAYRAELQRALQGQAPADARWPGVFARLQRAIASHRLPAAPLHALLDAFTQDVANPTYADRAALLGYCARSASPVGRLLLHLYGIDDEQALQRSDAVCSALQLANFWQDLGIDAGRGRHYVPLADLHRHGLALVDLQPGADSERTRALLRELVGWARTLMQEGAPLVHQLPGRVGWELRGVVQGGLRVLERIERGGCNALTKRPTIGAADLPLLAWRALRMRRTAAPQAATAGARGR